MRKAHAIKAEIVKHVKERIDNCAGVFLTDYQGFTVKEITELRRRLRETGTDYKIIKNSFMVKATNEGDLADLKKYLVGPVAIAFAKTDPVAPVKLLIDFIKETKKGSIKAGILGGKIIYEDEIKHLTNLPSKEVLIAQVLGGIKSPLNGLVNVLSGLLRGLVCVLKGIEEKRSN